MTKYAIELTQLEVDVLYTVLQHIGGCPEGSFRGVTDSINGKINGKFIPNCRYNHIEPHLSGKIHFEISDLAKCINTETRPVIPKGWL